MLIMTSFSDMYRTRGIPVMLVFVVGIVGWSLLLGINPVHASVGALKARYFACFCVVCLAPVGLTF